MTGATPKTAWTPRLRRGAPTHAERFEALYRSTRKDILAYLVRRSGDHEQAADLLAETYLIAWRKLPHVPNGHDGRLWLFGVARNLLLKDAKQRRSHNALVQQLAEQLRHAASSVAPEDDRAEAIGEALRSLPKRERELKLRAHFSNSAIPASLPAKPVITHTDL